MGTFMCVVIGKSATIVCYIADSRFDNVRHLNGSESPCSNKKRMAKHDRRRRQVSKETESNEKHIRRGQVGGNGQSKRLVEHLRRSTSSKFHGRTAQR